MTTSVNGKAGEQDISIVAAQGLLLASTVGDAKYCSLKNFARCEIDIIVSDGTTITAADITLLQATAVAGTGEKELAFATVKKAVDLGASQVLVATAVTSNTFKTQTTNSKDSRYVIDLTPDMLDVAGGFDCFRLDGANHAATNSRGFTVTYRFYGPRYSGANPLVD
jgi:hypothetical protein